LRKLKILLLPIIHTDWKRQSTESFDGNAPADKYKPPKQDVNAPDLYIPMMSFITFILLLGYVHGASGRFTPEFLGVSASSTLLTLGFEIAFMKGAFYFLGDVDSPVFLDLVAIGAYKYVGLIVDVLFSLVVSTWILVLITFLFSCFGAFFTIRSLNRAISRTIGNHAESSSKRDTFLLLLGGLQIFICFFLLRSVLVSLPTSGSSVPAPALVVGTGPHPEEIRRLFR